jgi:hypothetical protein
VEIFLSGANDRHSISTQVGVGAQIVSPPLQTVGAKKVPTQVNNMLIKINEDSPLRCMTLIKVNYLNILQVSISSYNKGSLTIEHFIVF